MNCYGYVKGFQPSKSFSFAARDENDMCPGVIVCSSQVFGSFSFSACQVVGCLLLFSSWSFSTLLLAFSFAGEDTDTGEKGDGDFLNTPSRVLICR